MGDLCDNRGLIGVFTKCYLLLISTLIIKISHYHQQAVPVGDGVNLKEVAKDGDAVAAKSAIMERDN